MNGWLNRCIFNLSQPLFVCVRVCVSRFVTLIWSICAFKFLTRLISNLCLPVVIYDLRWCLWKINHRIIIITEKKKTHLQVTHTHSYSHIQMSDYFNVIAFYAKNHIRFIPQETNLSINLRFFWWHPNIYHIFSYKLEWNRFFRFSFVLDGYHKSGYEIITLALWLWLWLNYYFMTMTIKKTKSVFVA